MGVSLVVRLVDGTEEHMPSVELEQLQPVFERIPWREQVERWLALTPEEQESSRPLFSLCDDGGRGLHITERSEELLAFWYEYPLQVTHFGFSHTDEQASEWTDACPRSELPRLLRAFCDFDQDAILRILAEHPPCDGQGDSPATASVPEP